MQAPHSEPAPEPEPVGDPIGEPEAGDDFELLPASETAEEYAPLPQGLWPKPPEIPGYEIGGPIGRGSSGVVYRARQLAVDREVAMKVLHMELAAKPTVVQRLQREARTTARLAHPHIVSAIDMGTAEGRWWFAMELVDGASLALRLKRDGALSERMALRLFIPLCEALEHLWENGVVHRDIKPANILLDKTGGARIADLGLAFSHEDPSLTGTGGTLGTPHYISPEQARDPASADVRSDIWSFGATLFHALCGRPPFQGESLAEVLSGVLYALIPDPHRLRPELSRGLVLVLRKCLSREPTQRYQTPRELLLDLERVRERRQPKVLPRTLDPLEGRLPLWAKLGIGVAAAALVAAPFALRFLLNDGNESGARADLVNAGPFAALESVAASIESGTSLPSEQLARLEALEPEVPAHERARWIELNARVKDSLRREVAGITGALVQESRGRVGRGDFAGALGLWNGDGAGRLIRATGFSTEGLPESTQSIWESRQRFEVREIESAQDLALENAREAMRRQREGGLEPEVNRLAARGDWVAAAQLAATGARELLADTRYGTTRFSPGLLDPLLEEVDRELRAQAQELEVRWNTQVDDELVSWIRGRASALEDGSKNANVARRSTLGEELRDAFERELRVRGLRRESFHPLGLRRALPELEEQAERLVALGDDALAKLVGNDLEATTEQLEPLWRARSYAAVGTALEAFAREVAELPGDADAPWRRDVLDRVRLLRLEAELLDGLMRRAATGLSRRAGREGEFRVGNILVRGRLEPQSDPFAYRIVSATGTAYDGRLDQNEPAAVEFFAGLNAEPADLAPADALVRALFRLREGDFVEANRIRDSGSLPRAGAGKELVGDLKFRLDGELQLRTAEVDRRTEAARGLLADLDAGARGPGDVVALVERLFSDYADLQVVRTRREDLRRRREAARKLLAGDGLESLSAGFGFKGEPEALTIIEGGRLRLDYDFSIGRTGTWSRGSWVEDVAGWRSSGEVRGPSDLEPPGASLRLRAPLAVERDEVSVKVTLEQLASSGPPKLFILTLAGYHIAFVGPSFPDRGGERWLVGTGTVRALLERLLNGEGTPAELLRLGQEHTVSVRADRQPGRLEVDLDGRSLIRMTSGTPDGQSRELTLRAWEPVRVIRAVVEAKRD